jgi:hypothetical protein
MFMAPKPPPCVPTEAPSPRRSPLAVQHEPSPKSVSITPLTTVPIEACFPEVVPIAAPLLTEVPPDAAQAAPIAVLRSRAEQHTPSPCPVPIAPLTPVPIEACFPQAQVVPIAVLPGLVPAVVPSDIPSIVTIVVPSLKPTSQVDPNDVLAVETRPPPSQDPTCPTGRSNPQEGCSDARVELDRLVQKSIKAYESASTWGEFVAQCKDPKGGFHPEVKHPPHRAAHLLDTLRRSGATVGMKMEPWSRQRQDEALKRGSHQSALLHTDFLCEEFVDIIHKGPWVPFPARLVLDKKNLRLSPLGVVPQRDR